jgi:hypothetical protein
MPSRASDPKNNAVTICKEHFFSSSAVSKLDWQLPIVRMFDNMRRSRDRGQVS